VLEEISARTDRARRRPASAETGGKRRRS
jgi:hypothetical protein